MALDPAFLRTVEKHITSRWKKGCPMCGANEWEVIGSTFVELSGLAHARDSLRTGEGGRGRASRVLVLRMGYPHPTTGPWGARMTTAPTVKESTSPVVRLRRMKDVNTFEVMDHELTTFDSIVSAENQSLGFFSLLLGIFVPSAISWIVTPKASWLAWITYAVATCVSALMAAWFFMVWREARERRPALIKLIRDRAQAEPES